MTEEPDKGGGFVLRRAAGLVLLALLTACGATSSTTILAPAPILYTSETGKSYPAEGVPAGLRRTLTEILYVTDRNPLQNEAGELSGYGSQRSASMAFGVSLVEYGELEDWQDLVARTHEAESRGLTRLEPVYLEEFARFPQTPLPFEETGGRLQTTAQAQKAYDARTAVMQDQLGKRLRNHKLNRILVYIHGVNNEFEDGIGTLANIWHYSGRQSLPVAYSWPAGNSGLLAYFRDAESAEYSVFHVKEFLRMLAATDGVDRIDIVAHSHGGAVITDALRELLIEARAKGQDPRKVMKTGILVLAAPDLDVGVAQQRLAAERFGQAFEQINVYTNPNDEVLHLSRIVGNVTRLGSVGSDTFSQAELEQLSQVGNVNFIMPEQLDRRLGHAYFRENPAVMSDIVLALRSRQLPGSAFRPLEQINEGIWGLHVNYPAAPLPDVLDVPLVDR